MSCVVAVTDHTSSHLHGLISHRRENLSAAVISGASPDELASQVDALAVLYGALEAATSIESELRRVTDTEDLIVVAEAIIRSSRFAPHAEYDNTTLVAENAAGRATVARAYIQAVESGMSLEEIRSNAGIELAVAAA